METNIKTTSFIKRYIIDISFILNNTIGTAIMVNTIDMLSVTVIDIGSVFIILSICVVTISLCLFKFLYLSQ
jgi:hypothetical protein